MKKVGILFIYWWQLWIERNRRIFDDVEHSVPSVASFNSIADSYAFLSRGLTLPLVLQSP
jgi:hypothetical protein